MIFFPCSVGWERGGLKQSECEADDFDVMLILVMYGDLAFHKYSEVLKHRDTFVFMQYSI
jgi:hypothetical protein